MFSKIKALLSKQTLLQKINSAIETTQLQIIQAEFELIESQCQLEAYDQKLKALYKAREKQQSPGFSETFPPLALND